MRLVLEDSGFGSEPNLETQRFVPELHQTHGFPHFSWRECGRVRSRRGARIEPASPIRLDLQNSGASCYRSDTTGIVISLGLTPGSRKSPLLGRRPAGAAHGSDSIDKLATLFPPFRTIGNINGTESIACQGLFSVRERECACFEASQEGDAPQHEGDEDHHAIRSIQYPTPRHSRVRGNDGNLEFNRPSDAISSFPTRARVYVPNLSLIFFFNPSRTSRYESRI